MDLKTFLLTRIEEDEALAREEDDDYADTTLLPTYDSEHQANWNTARVLAECDAKRKVLTYFLGLAADKNRSEEHQAQFRSVRWVIEQMASVYADHPDYQPDWEQERDTK